MSTRYLILALALAFATPNSEAATTANSVAAHKAATTANTKSTKNTVKATKKRRVASGRGAYFVPPPPAYMPSVLPELYARQPLQIDEEEEEEVVAALAPKPKNPYVKYFYTRDEHAPKPVQSRNGVSTWVVSR
ncbi:MAG: hypothetical protein K2X77_04750 [Candidatus Obscuribacterales bacterium]|jgi:hypothetical protein|nr:hypothetical protein [Candidatus Obscuribacterales bacterium]